MIIRRNILAILAILIALATGTARAQGDGSRVQAPLPPGKMVDAGGHRLHLYCTGHGSPTVVVETGSGDFSFDWSLVQPAVSRFARICTYDRAGYAWSEPGPVPRTFRQITFELATALKNAGIDGPYVMAGQSYGGFLARAFARFYPKDVVGMVLVEAVNEDSRIVIGGKALRIRDWAKGREFPAAPVANYTPRKDDLTKDAIPAADRKLEAPYDRLSPEMQRYQLWAEAQPAFRQAVGDEMDWSPEELQKMYENRGRSEYMLGDMPLVVLTRGEGGYADLPGVSAAELENERLRLQADLAGLSSNSVQIIDKKSGHNIHLEDPATVIEAFRRVVDAARRRKALVPDNMAATRKKRTRRTN